MDGVKGVYLRNLEESVVCLGYVDAEQILILNCIDAVFIAYRQYGMRHFMIGLVIAVEVNYILYMYMFIQFKSIVIHVGRYLMQPLSISRRVGWTVILWLMRNL